MAERAEKDSQKRSNYFRSFRSFCGTHKHLYVPRKWQKWQKGFARQSNHFRSFRYFCGTHKHLYVPRKWQKWQKGIRKASNVHFPLFCFSAFSTFSVGAVGGTQNFSYICTEKVGTGMKREVYPMAK